MFNLSLKVKELLSEFKAVKEFLKLLKFKLNPKLFISFLEKLIVLLVSILLFKELLELKDLLLLLSYKFEKVLFKFLF